MLRIMTPIEAALDDYIIIFFVMPIATAAPPVAFKSLSTLSPADMPLCYTPATTMSP